MALPAWCGDDGVPADWERRTAPRPDQKMGQRRGASPPSASAGEGRLPATSGRTTRPPSGEAGGRRRFGALVDGRRPGHRSPQPGRRPAGRRRLPPDARRCRRTRRRGRRRSGCAGKLVRDLMQGRLLQPAGVDALRSTLAEGGGRARANRGVGQPGGACWPRCAAAARRAKRQARGGTLDWRTLEILLDMLGLVGGHAMSGGRPRGARCFAPRR